MIYALTLNIWETFTTVTLFFVESLRSRTCPTMLYMLIRIVVFNNQTSSLCTFAWQIIDILNCLNLLETVLSISFESAKSLLYQRWIFILQRYFSHRAANERANCKNSNVSKIIEKNFIPTKNFLQFRRLKSPVCNNSLKLAARCSISLNLEHQKENQRSPNDKNCPI